MASRSARSALTLEIDGPSASPREVDARAALELAAAYFDLVERTARNDGRSLRLTGIEVVDKCVAFRVAVSDMAAARATVMNVGRYIYGGVQVPQGLSSSVERVRKAVQDRLDAKQSVSAIAGKKKTMLQLAQRQGVLPPEASLSVRAKVVQVGGESPRAKFESPSEGPSFMLRLGEQLATALGAYLYKWVDIEAMVRRDGDGFIVDGRLEAFHPVGSREALSSLKAWLDNAGEPTQRQQ